jgi:NADH-quinone oxidoreductase subunit I
MWKFLKEIFDGIVSLCAGMWITLRQSFRRPVTVDYPYRTLRMPERFRGHIELIANRVTGEPNCVVCMACQKACPSFCIRVNGYKPAGAPRKVPTIYILDFTTCSLCGLCVESCRFDALTFSKEYNLASFRKEDYVMDMLDRLRKAKP